MFFIIWGSRGRLKTTGKGVFHCPKCGCDRNYRRLGIQRWFTLFFIPIFPMGGTKGDVVRCSHCNTDFNPKVLQAPTTAQLSAQLQSAAIVSVVCTAAAGDPSSDLVRDTAVAVLQEAGVPYSHEQLGNDLQHASGAAVGQFVAPLAGSLSPQGAENFVARLARVATADGPVTDRQASLLQQVAMTLGLSSTHLNGILAERGQSPVTPPGPAGLPTLAEVMAATSQPDEPPAPAEVPAAGPPAGWYPDPHGSGHRWWDGGQWTEHVHG